MNIKDQALDIFMEHLPLAKTDGKLFRKTVMDSITAATGCSHSSASTNYNNSLRLIRLTNPEAVQGLGRPPLPRTVCRPGKARKHTPIQPDNECYSILEMVPGTSKEMVVGRCQSFLTEQAASQSFDSKTNLWPNSVWVMIKGLGPISGDNLKLMEGEKELKWHIPSNNC